MASSTGGGFTITQLPSGGAVLDTDAFVIARGSNNFQVSVPLETITDDIALINEALTFKANLVGGVVPTPELPLTSSTTLGVSQVDGTTIVASTSGVISLASGAGVTYATQAQVNAGTSANTAVSPSTLANSSLLSAKADLVATPIAGDLLTTNASGQPQDSGVKVSTDGAFSSPSNSQVPTTLAVQQYVQTTAITVYSAVQAATVANITLTGLQTIDGVVLIAGNRILVKNQTSQADNGVYIVNTDAWLRSADLNTWNALINAYVFVQAGVQNGNTGWVCNIASGGTLGITPVTWIQFSSAGSYTAGVGLTLTGTQFSIADTGVVVANYGIASAVSTIAVNAQGQITSASNTMIAIDGSQITSGTVTPTRLPISGVANAQTNISANTVLGATDYSSNVAANGISLTLPLGSAVVAGAVFYVQVGNYTGVQIAPNSADSIFPAGTGVARYLAPNSTYQYRFDGTQWWWIG